MDHKLRRKRKNGYVLVTCLGVVFTTAVLVLMFFSFSQETEQAATKR